MKTRDAALWAVWIGVPVAAGLLLFGLARFAWVLLVFVAGPLMVMWLVARRGESLPYWGAWLCSTAALSVIWAIVEIGRG